MASIAVVSGADDTAAVEVPHVHCVQSHPLLSRASQEVSSPNGLAIQKSQVCSAQVGGQTMVVVGVVGGRVDTTVELVD